MQESKKYWKGLEELNNTPEFAQAAHNEFAEFLPVKETFGSDATEAEVAPRRDFLKLLGFGLAAATLASCEAPVRKAIPYLNKPEDVEPGIANWYASTYFQGGDYNSILVKTREGRPIKLEGNPLSGVTKGGLSAKAQAAVLSLYDNNRLSAPMKAGKASNWKDIDAEIMNRLASAKGKVVLVSSTIISPTTKKAIAEFGAKANGFEHVVYDANSASGLVKANGGVIPGYDFSKAKVIVSVAADFLGTWISPVEYAKQYIQTRKITKDKSDMSRHFQFESNLSLTGSNADVRVAIKPSEEALVVAAIYNKVVGGISAPAFSNKALDKAISELTAARGAALLVAGTNDQGVQTMVRAINQALGAEGTTINTNAPSYLRQGDDTQMIRLINDMKNGLVGAAFFYDANPAYDHPMAEEVLNGLKNVDLKVSFADRINETAKLCDFICPDHNFLESWNDFEPKKGFLSLSQPAISPIFKTRQAQESLLKWSGNNTDYYTYLKNNWAGFTGSGSGWDKAVHDGVLENVSTTGQAMPNVTALSTGEIGATLNKGAQSGIELAIYEKVGLGTGSIEANNPWLQELPDPITKATWDNYVTVPISMAKEKEIEQGDLIKLTARNGQSVTLPALIQPGQAKNTVGVAIGYGRKLAGKVADNVGGNVYPLATVTKDGIIFNSTVSFEKVGGSREIAQTQTHQTVMGRIVVQESTLDKYKKDPKSVTEYVKIATPDGPKKPAAVSLWQDYEYKDHHWGMVIDLNSCIGCGSCVIGCNVENNVAIVGKQEVINRREMHWMRIDRYYSTDATREDGFTEMENPAENPSVIFQPMLCQHCNHAPCETVCPVLATTHSTEGLNQMTYNRCVGTRYCANNCPYKVRRFNWFSYPDNEKFTDVNTPQTTDLGRMVLNPDVTVRARGVMEKCSFCVQRIQSGKLEAKKEKRKVKDGEIVTACAQSCPTNAIVFGDLKDPNSQVRQIMAREQGERAFTVLEEINTQPNISYLTKIRNLA
ncbi:TAT-variant-translocated molybdopterin oxidoreductase [Adhaeribacter sp. BT258]|uniref:TAT-variant-translocated molybdopterin oxidoreductase n=1 Tax=Adhaeribacter terrigena TaxID=2793070 RepID=A0ABS1BYV0_9BACT|nr:TAT-variant-translocated molybdopterin oxidoreductase [Adhaeribacter terrigena]MBK0402302.1 TAT-variant-translocated molybdopterin oxidoreductase [Adhaeribacter terrigena]